MSYEDAHALFLAAAGKLRGIAFEVHALGKHYDHIFHRHDHLRLESKASRIGKMIADLKARLARPNWENKSVMIFAASRHRSGVDRHASRSGSEGAIDNRAFRQGELKAALAHLCLWRSGVVLNHEHLSHFELAVFRLDTHDVG